MLPRKGRREIALLSDGTWFYKINVEQNGCNNCGHVFVDYEYEGGDSYYLHVWRDTSTSVVHARIYGAPLAAYLYQPWPLDARHCPVFRSSAL